MASTSLKLLASAELVKQGAEARVYKVPLHPPQAPGTSDALHSVPTHVALKHRFQKQYRHPSLNSSLTRARVAGEARALMKCLRSGVSVPGIRMVDATEGAIGIEWIEGKSVRTLLGGGDESEQEENDEEVGETYDASSVDETDGLLTEFGLSQTDVMLLIGNEIAKMHAVDIIHGDLTTSNMMLRHKSTLPNSLDSYIDGQYSTELVLIDFGLSFTSALAEDKAVDLYVLERAFASTHPDSEPLFISVMKAYEETSGRNWAAVCRKLDEVRLRGRKRSMVG